MFEELKKKQRPGFSIPFTQVRDPKRRIIVLCGLFILLVAAAFWLKGFESSPEANRVTGPDEPSKHIPGEPVFTGVPTLDPQFVAGIADATPEEQGRWEEAAIAYLLHEARSTPAVWAYNRNLLPVTEQSAKGITADPKAWRFKFVRFRGEIEYINEVDYADRFAGDETIGQVHHGRLRLTGGDTPLRVTFVTPVGPSYADPNEPTTTPETQIISEGWVRGRGIFVKNYRDVGPDGAEVPSLLCVVMQLQRDFAPQPVNSKDDIPFQIIDDDPSLLERGADGKKLLFKTYPKPLFRLVKYAEKRSGESGEALRAKEKLVPKSFDSPKKMEKLLGSPVVNRMAYFGGLGATALDTIEIGPEDITDDNANDAGVDHYITGWIYTDKKQLFQFVAPSTLPAYRRKTRIRYEGFFYKTQAYYARGGTERMAPFLVLTRFEKVDPPPEDHTAQFMIAGAFILGILLLVFIIVREDKTKANYRHLRRAARKKLE